MLQKNGEPQPKVEKLTTEEEKKLQEKSKRTSEDIKKVFIETYGFEENDAKLAKLVERELAHSKVVSKLIGQKIHWRDKASETKEEKKLIDDSKDDSIRSIERNKAAEKFLSKISEKFTDLDAETAYEKVKEVYREKGDETLRGDFEKRIWQAFWVAFPDKYEEHIREKSKKEKEEFGGDRISTSKGGVKQKQTEKKFFIKKTNPKDWFTKK